MGFDDKQNVRTSDDMQFSCELAHKMLDYRMWKLGETERIV
jgi:hypothetical protein